MEQDDQTNTPGWRAYFTLLNGDLQCRYDSLDGEYAYLYGEDYISNYNESLIGVPLGEARVIVYNLLYPNTHDGKDNSDDGGDLSAYELERYTHATFGWGTHQQDDVEEMLKYREATGGTCLGEALAWVEEIERNNGQPGTMIASAANAKNYQESCTTNPCHNHQYLGIADLEKLEHVEYPNMQQATKALMSMHGTFLIIIDTTYNNENITHAYAFHAPSDGTACYFYDSGVCGEYIVRSANAIVTLMRSCYWAADGQSTLDIFKCASS